MFARVNKMIKYALHFRNSVFWKLIKKITRAAAAAGVPRITWHELRHYFASAQLALKGGTKDGIWKVSNQLGHSDTTITTKTYGNCLDDYSEDPEETAREAQAALRY